MLHCYPYILPFLSVPCAAGSFSETGVEPCELCPVGTYQTFSNKKKCVKCPEGHVTRGKGALSGNECQGKFKNIYNKNNGGCTIVQHTPSPRQKCRGEGVLHNRDHKIQNSGCQSFAVRDMCF